MANIREFRGLRPGKEIAHLVSELPYDVIDSKNAKDIAQKNLNSFFHISKPEVDLPEDINVYSDIVYETGRKNLSDFIKNGSLKLDEMPMLYSYTLIMNNREQTGLVCCVKIDDYLNDIIKKHELTREVKETDRLNHIEILNAQTGLVFLLYKEDGSKTHLFEQAVSIEPEYDFTTNDGIRHIFRLINDINLINSFKKSFKDEIIYIADGHHRTASAVKTGLRRREKYPDFSGEEEYNWFLSVIFPHNQLKILPYNRVVKDLNNLTKQEFLNRISEVYSIEQTKKKLPEKNRRFNMYFDGEWYSLKPKFTVPDDPVKSLDVKMLQDTLLEPILGIGDPRKDHRIDFIGGIKETDELERVVNAGEFIVAFSMFPTSIEELMSVSDSGGIMPPKSTWFEPKLRGGLITHLL